MGKQIYDVIVIGGGPNGLICSAYLAKAGLKVVLLEARHETGGGLDTLEFAGFKYNTHAIYHMMAEIMPVYHDFDLKSRGVKYIYPDVQAAYINPGKKPLLFYKDPQKTARHMAADFSSKDADAYLKMMTDFAEYSEKILIPCTYVPSMPPIEQVQMLSSATDDVGKRFSDIAELPPIDILDMYDFSDLIKASVLNLFTMWGLSPYDALGYIFPLYVYRMTNAAICSGGSHRLSSAIHKAVIESGGVILDESNVVKILLKDGYVNGVLLEDGTEINTKAVASTVDPHQTFLKFFDDGQLPAHLVDSAKRWEWESSTFFGAHLALKGAPSYLGSEKNKDANQALITFLGVGGTDDLLEHYETLQQGKLPEKRLFGHTTCASLFDPIQAPKGYHTGRWESLVPYNLDWESMKHDFAEKCIEEWKSYAPDLDPINTLVYPPTYIEKKIKNMVKGSIKHGAYVPLQMGYFRPNESCSQTYTSIEGLYVCGASVYPGGMIIGGPGYIGANMITEDFGLKKPWKEPEMVIKARERGIIPHV
ncbi:MAG: NAD(P)/FAD-dependent oxidoreductase [Proteobacteria bacterium]|nr:NAD(P)/FAD-dependent oxidoreductase [Pseudomonadota bacterium]